MESRKLLCGRADAASRIFTQQCKYEVSLFALFFCFFPYIFTAFFFILSPFLHFPQDISIILVSFGSSQLALAPVQMAAGYSSSSLGSLSLRSLCSSFVRFIQSIPVHPLRSVNMPHCIPFHFTRPCPLKVPDSHMTDMCRP